MAHYEDITTDELKARLEKGEKLNMIDVREDDEVATGMIPGARHIRLSEIPDRLGEIDLNQETIMICRSGGRSSRASEFLASQGYKHIKNMVGGMLNWNGPVTK